MIRSTGIGQTPRFSSMLITQNSSPHATKTIVKYTVDDNDTLEFRSVKTDSNEKIIAPPIHQRSSPDDKRLVERFKELQDYIRDNLKVTAKEFGLTNEKEAREKLADFIGKELDLDLPNADTIQSTVQKVVLGGGLKAGRHKDTKAPMLIFSFMERTAPDIYG